MTFRLLFVGDVVGSAGCSAVLDLVPELREELGLDAVVANAENSAPGGRGITKESGSSLLSVVDFLTLGNHAFDAEGHEELLERDERVVRPANFGEGPPGRGWGLFEAAGVAVGVTNVLGRIFVTGPRSRPSRPLTGQSRSWRRWTPTWCWRTSTRRPRARSRRSDITWRGGRRRWSELKNTRAHGPQTSELRFRVLLTEDCSELELIGTERRGHDAGRSFGY